jgi:hypothetical protein
MTLHSDRVIALLEQGGLAALQAERGLAELLDSGYLQKRASRP